MGLTDQREIRHIVSEPNSSQAYYNKVETVFSAGQHFSVYNWVSATMVPRNAVKCRWDQSV